MATDPSTRTEYAVEHSQGMYRGDSFRNGLTLDAAREWAAENRRRDSTRQLAYRGKTRIVSRQVTGWAPVVE